MYDKFIELCEKRGVNANQVAKATGLAYSTFSDWKAGRSKPKIDKLVKIAAFFDVPVTVFLPSGDTRMERRGEE